MGTAASLQPAHLVLWAEATRGIFHTAHWGRGDLPHVLPQRMTVKSRPTLGC